MCKAIQKNTLLLVDDDDAVREAIKLIISLHFVDLDIIEASGGDEAFEIVCNNKIDFVLTDVRMPAGDGIELLEKIKNYNSETPQVTLITGFSCISREDAIKKGALELFHKPFDIAKIGKLLKDCNF